MMQLEYQSCESQVCCTFLVDLRWFSMYFQAISSNWLDQFCLCLTSPFTRQLDSSPLFPLHSCFSYRTVALRQSLLKLNQWQNKCKASRYEIHAVARPIFWPGIWVGSCLTTTVLHRFQMQYSSWSRQENQLFLGWVSALYALANSDVNFKSWCLHDFLEGTSCNSACKGLQINPAALTTHTAISITMWLSKHRGEAQSWINFKWCARTSKSSERMENWRPQRMKMVIPLKPSWKYL